jgi:hypothetical protein
MTDLSKYKNVSLPHKTHDVLMKLSKAMLPDAKLSMSKVIESLAYAKAKKLKIKGIKTND